MHDVLVLATVCGHVILSEAKDLAANVHDARLEGPNVVLCDTRFFTSFRMTCCGTVRE